MGIKTLLYGGAFDPVHVAHKLAAVNALNYMAAKQGYEELWFLPCYSDAFGEKNMETPEHRVTMLEHIINDIGDIRFRICTEELEMANDAGTYAVIRRLIKAYPGRQFGYLLGNDQAQLIRNWRNSRKLVMTIPFVVMPRAGVHAWHYSYWYRHKPHFYMDKPAIKSPVSSTAIRTDFANQWDAWKHESHPMLTATVQSHIIRHGLYKGEKVSNG